MTLVQRYTAAPVKLHMDPGMTSIRTILLLACALLAGCGQTGPLYPQPEPDELAGSAAAQQSERAP